MLPIIFRRSLSTSRCLGFWGKKDVINPIVECNKGQQSSELISEFQVKNLLNSSATFVDEKHKYDYDTWSTLPYAQGTVITKSTGRQIAIRAKIDPQDTTVILFPGQGSQFLGMAKSLEHIPAAKDLFDWASDILNYDLMKLCNEGPRRRLNDIRYSHVALFTTCLGYVEKLREERPEAVYNCIGTAGFSVGEIAALVFAGSLHFDQALQLVQLRAEAIQLAGEMHKGGMASIFYGADSEVVKACKMAREHCLKSNIENPDCLISNFMYPNYKVLSGNEEALDYLQANFKKFRLRSFKRIRNAPPLHCGLMKPAAEEIAKALAHIQIADPLINVFSNVTGKAYHTAKRIKKIFPKQIEKPVKWEQIMTQIYARRRGCNFPRTFICGPNLALGSCMRHVNYRAFRRLVQVGDVDKKKNKKNRHYTHISSVSQY